MTLKRAGLILVTAGLVGAIIGIALSGDDFISARVWLGAAAVTVVAILLREFLAISSVEHATFVSAWSLRRPHRTNSGPPGLQNIHALLIDARTSPRSFTIRLRPRLVELADHFLPLRSGIDFEHDPDQVAQLLGDVSWIIDSAVQDRSPTLAEVERFLDLTLVDRDGSPR